jgi:LPPG:FO 2-phospho-L-lactate transferase
VLALAGGVGGAKLANGLAAVLPPGELTVAVNTGDDFEHMGLSISPDIDTVLYTLAGINNRDLGWGQQDESWAFMDAAAKLGGEAWFRLGDRDLATHVLRGQRLRSGETLSAVTADFATRLGIRQAIVPMSDDPVRSMVDTDEGELPFQDYFVRRQCQPRFRSIRFDGVEGARPGVGLIAALDDPGLEAIILCPSNPLLSIAPILALPGIADRLAARRVPCIAVSPFIAGKAVKGPAAKIMAELGLPTTPSAIADHYGALLDALIIDSADADLAPTGLEVLAVPTLMQGDADQARLASEALAMARRIGPRLSR